MIQESRKRTFLKTLHSLSVCGWIGGGISILIILNLAGTPRTGNEIAVIQRCIKAIDDFLITPSAGIATVTGLWLGALRPWGFKGQRWITQKCAITTVLLIFGALWLAPGLQTLAPHSGAGVNRTSLLWGSTAAMLQTSVLLLLVVLSFLKPGRAKA